MDYILKLESIPKYVRNIQIECDNHITITHLINKVEVALTADFDSLTHLMFHELRFEMLLNDLGVDENKDAIAKYIDKSDQ